MHFAIATLNIFLYFVKHNGHYIGCVWMHAGGMQRKMKKAQETPGTNRIETIPIFVKRCGLLHDWCNIIMHFPHNIVIVWPLWFIRHPSTCRDNNNTKAKIAQTTTTMTKEEFVLPPPSIYCICTGKAFTRRRRAINWAFFLLPLNTIQSHLVNR